MLRGTKTQSKGWHLPALTLGLLLPVMAAAPAAAQSPREAGLWYDDTGRGAVELLPCGANLCGRIVWLKDPLNDKGQPLVDRYNPNPARRTTPICGLQIIGGLKPMPEGTWDTGWIYDPKTGSAYDAAIQLQRADQLKVTGYKGVKLFSKSFTWMRAPADLPRCDVAAAGRSATVPAPKKATKPGTAAAGEALPWAKQ